MSVLTCTQRETEEIEYSSLENGTSNTYSRPYLASCLFSTDPDPRPNVHDRPGVINHKQLSLVSPVLVPMCLSLSTPSVEDVSRSSTTRLFVEGSGLGASLPLSDSVRRSRLDSVY